MFLNSFKLVGTGHVLIASIFEGSGKMPELLTMCPRYFISLEFLLDTDASGFGLGAVLSQIGPDNKEHVIAYFSKALTKPERQYCVTGF
jgi:hypothetical protein